MIVHCESSDAVDTMETNNGTLGDSRVTAQNHIQTYALNTNSILENTFAYFWNTIAATIARFLFYVLNRTKVVGRSNFLLRKNTLFVSNHQTLIDSFLIGTVVFWPILFLKPSLIPWHPAALENFFKTRFLAFCSKFWKCIPIKRGSRDFLALNFMIDALKSGTMILFPEGTRSRTGEIGKGKIGVGKLIYDAKPYVIPVAISGMNKVLPIGAAIPRIFKSITIKFGKPLDLEDLYNQGGNKHTSMEIVNRIMNAIQNLKTDQDPSCTDRKSSIRNLLT